MTSLPPRELDVRPLLATGRQPLPQILRAINELAPGQALRLVAPIEPRPLYDLLGARGFTAAARQREDGAWEVLFSPAG